MATVDQVQDQLGRTEKSPRIIETAYPTSLITSYYTVGGPVHPGRARWCDCTTADSAATQAAAIVAKLAE